MGDVALHMTGILLTLLIALLAYGLGHVFLGQLMSRRVRIPVRSEPARRATDEDFE